MGCVAVPYPRINTRSEAIEGQITDKRTGRPIADVAVQPAIWYADAKAPTPLSYPVAKSDAKGFFKLPKSDEFRALYIVMGACGAGLRNQSDTHYRDYLISKDGYITQQLSYLSTSYARSNGAYQIGKVYLHEGSSRQAIQDIDSGRE
jgi:hypothetical protein